MSVGRKRMIKHLFCFFFTFFNLLFSHYSAFLSKKKLVVGAKILKDTILASTCIVSVKIILFFLQNMDTNESVTLDIPVPVMTTIVSNSSELTKLKNANKELFHFAVSTLLQNKDK